ncbi:MAG TPA: DUF4010 domain-containing protein [Burkholderiaceae bacterium]|jgi:uncharacterized membrane protein (DUF4010 family)|nr:DUF4010 domain-containing protein [Burkholderiaceae bacterium]
MTSLETQDTWISLSAAVGVGLLVGLERERRKADGPRRIQAGIRTFTIVSLLGAASTVLETSWAVPAAMLALAGLLATAYACGTTPDAGITTAAALLLTLALGALAMRAPEMAVSIGVVATVVLAARARLHAFVRQTITDDELRDGLILAAAALVVLPFIPNRYIGPLQAFNPRTTWTIVVLILGVGALGHVAQRMLGAARGLAAAGFASGFVSSLATVGAMGARVRQSPAMLRPAVAGALMSCVATIIQLAAVVGASSVDSLRALAGPLLAAGITGTVVAAGSSVWALRQPAPSEILVGRAFSLGKALGLAATVTALTWISFVLQDRFGQAGLTLGVAIAGFADAHAAAASVASLVASGRLPAHDAVVPILAALSTNAVSKTVMSITSGGARFAIPVVSGVAIQMAAAWGVAIMHFG